MLGNHLVQLVPRLERLDEQVGRQGDHNPGGHEQEAEARDFGAVVAESVAEHEKEAEGEAADGCCVVQLVRSNKRRLRKGGEMFNCSAYQNPRRPGPENSRRPELTPRSVAS
jgi:hypothetical protein